jgi:F-type H+-transporting ATPase subunit b
MTIMGTFLLLVASAGTAEAEMAEATGKVGLNFNILDTNLINLVIIITVLLYFGRKLVGKTLSDRRERIETAIRSAEQRRKDAAAALAEQQQNLARAQAEAQKIRATAEENAKIAREAILAAAAQDIERMRESADREVNTERDRVIAQLRQQVVAMALEKVESQLRSGIADPAQQQLIDRSIALLGGGS